MRAPGERDPLAPASHRPAVTDTNTLQQKIPQGTTCRQMAHKYTEGQNPSVCFSTGKDKDLLVIAQAAENTGQASFVAGRGVHVDDALLASPVYQRIDLGESLPRVFGLLFGREGAEPLYGRPHFAESRSVPKSPLLVLLDSFQCR